MNTAIVRQPTNESFRRTSFLDSTNATYIESLHVRYVEDHNSVGPEWQNFFSSLDGDMVPVAPGTLGTSSAPARQPISWKHASVTAFDANHSSLQGAFDQTETIKSDSCQMDIGAAIHDTVRVLTLIGSFRVNGHLHARVDPLELATPDHDGELDPSSYGFGEADLKRRMFVGGALGLEFASLHEIVVFLRNVYCGTVGYEYMHITDPVRRRWIQDRVEVTTLPFDADRKRATLQTLMEVTAFEEYLAKKFVGATRFGLDGAESTIVALEEIIGRAASLGVEDVVLGMAHRGRLAVLAQVMKKPKRAIFSEFEGSPLPLPDGIVSSGDVKYHLGASADREFARKRVHLSLAANPSHLEFIDPVVLGEARAKQELRSDPGERASVLPLLIHGDAAFTGQGVVCESLGLSALKGYQTGGSVHLIINNQVGFTTDPGDLRSSKYPSDVAKTIDAPVFHVNGDDPEAVAGVARLAIEYRQTFHRPVVIDLICTRRFGHNEGDEPSFTQPIMYKAIRSRGSTLALYERRLRAEQFVSLDDLNSAKARLSAHLDMEFEASKTYRPNGDWLGGRWSGMLPMDIGDEESGEETTGVRPDRLRSIGDAITTPPDNFVVHSTIGRFLETRRRATTDGKGIDWATAEALAFASLADEGYRVRLSGQDSQRGTFSQRHAVIFDQETGARYMPLSHIGPEQAPCEVFNSMLSEAAVLGFEYGYSLAEPRALVLWEAQYGDFANGAQVIFDQFLSSAEQKWLRMSGIVCLLPHGYDGQGPEHSSARLERFLQSCAEENWQIANCSTPANYFHILRRQMVRSFRKPLILMTPKSLLRQKRCRSSLTELSGESRFQQILRDDGETSGTIVPDESVRKVLLCSGKIYYDLESERAKRGLNDIYILRIEQLYPFPAKSLASELARFSGARTAWCQEEPRNMGAWSFVEPYLEHAAAQYQGMSRRPEYIGRAASAATATGLLSQHFKELQAIMDQAFTLS